MSVVFYDTETTGSRVAFDQIVHFAAIRTDGDLNETDRFEARSRLLPHLVPSPGAMRVTGLSVGGLTDPGQRWSRFVRQAAKVDLPMRRMIHHEDAETVFV